VNDTRLAFLLLPALALGTPGCMSPSGAVRGAVDPVSYRLQSPTEGDGVSDRAGAGDHEGSGPTPPPLFLSRLREWVQEDDPDGSGEGEDYDDKLGPRSDPGVNIRHPDPDTANFPNSAFTIPQGRAYVETSPVSFYGPSAVSPRLQNWEFLLRYGVTDRMEFRIFSNGFTNQYGSLSYPGPDRRKVFNTGPTSGFSPLVFDVKFHLWDESKKNWLPAAGAEIYIETNLGSPAFNQGTQPSLNLLFDHSLPAGFQLEWNAGIAGNQTPTGTIFYNLALQWALQHPLFFKDFNVFTHGFLNNAALPRFGQPVTRTAADVLVVGAGAVYTLNDRTAVFGSYNFGLTQDSPEYLALLGLAYAL
jgi:hypothetical protein